MELEGQYFVFDWSADYSEGTTGFAIMQVENGKLEERFHPLDVCDLGPLGKFEDKIALDYLVKNSVQKVFTVKYLVESPATFLGHIMGYRKELTDPDLVPGQWEWYSYDSVNTPSRQKLLKDRGIEVIVLDPAPYVTKSVQLSERPPAEQLLLI